MENKKRSLFKGTVISTKMDKTIIVLVKNYFKHIKYKKRVQRIKKYYVHDEKNEANVGDLVTIMSVRPLSKTKRFCLVKIDKKSVIKTGLELNDENEIYKKNTDKSVTKENNGEKI